MTMRGAKIYLRRDPHPLCVGVEASLVMDALNAHPPNEPFIRFRGVERIDQMHAVRVADVVVVTDVVYSDG